MSLDFTLYYDVNGVDEAGEQLRYELFSANITHNLAKMADAAGIYKVLWQPEEVRAAIARDILPRLTDGLRLLQANPARFRRLNALNGWGKYENLVEFVRKVLTACERWPDAKIHA